MLGIECLVLGISSSSEFLAVVVRFRGCVESLCPRARCMSSACSCSLPVSVSGPVFDSISSYREREIRQIIRIYMATSF